MMTMNMYIIYSRIDHLQEAEDGMADGVGWFRGICSVAIYFISTVKVSCVDCIKRRGELHISFKKDGNSKISRMNC